VEEILSRGIDAWGEGSYELDKSVQPHEAMLLKLDISKARAELKWEPVNNVYTTVENTIDWYKQYYKNSANMKEYTIKQIKDYVSEAKKKEIKWSVSND
jgi:CDP-glucose 4,6-dehydratase